MGCIIFDLDGTLVDSEPACSRALLELIPELSIDLVALTDRYRGWKLAEILADLETRLALKLPAGFETAYRDRVAAIFETELRAMPEAEEALSTIEVPMCVASSGPMNKIRHALDLTGLARFFGQHIYSSYEVGFWKPDPRLFLHAATEMGGAPDCCVVVEDSPVGVAAAISAGMRAIQYLPHANQAIATGATAINDLRQLRDVRFRQ